MRTLTIEEFRKHFKLISNSLKTTIVSKKNRAGIANLGNTCYMNATLQAFFSLCKFEDFRNPKGEITKELKDIYEKISEKKKSVFPIQFKTVFDRCFDFFIGQDQHDAHEFLICLLDMIEKENP